MSDLSIESEARDWATSWELHLGFRSGTCSCNPGGRCLARRFDGSMIAPAAALERLVDLFQETASASRARFRTGHRGTRGREEFDRAVTFLETRAAHVETLSRSWIAEIRAREAAEDRAGAARAAARRAQLLKKYPRD